MLQSVYTLMAVSASQNLSGKLVTALREELDQQYEARNGLVKEA